MLAHPPEEVKSDNNLLKVCDMPVIMATDPFESELVYPQHVGGRLENGCYSEPSQYYQQQQQQYEQQYHHFNSPVPPGESNHHPHQHLEPHMEYYQHQQMMYCHQNQGMGGYGGYHQDQYGGYYQPPQHPTSHQPPPHHAYHQYPPNQQSMLVNNGPSSHGSHNCTPSPHANSDDSGGDCVNEPKQLQLSVPPQYPGQPSMPFNQSYNQDQAGVDMGVPPKPMLPTAVINRSLTAARRGKKSKHRDPNEPQKPVSAYALFFRDMQAGIKVRNPNSSFGEVSKHVASMWDGLDPEHKAVYKRRTETAKKEYLKRLAAYRASLVSKGGSPGPDQLGLLGGPRYPGGFDNVPNPVGVDVKDLSPVNKDIQYSRGTTSPVSLQSPRLGSPPSGVQVGSPNEKLPPSTSSIPTSSFAQSTQFSSVMSHPKGSEGPFQPITTYSNSLPRTAVGNQFQYQSNHPSATINHQHQPQQQFNQQPHLTKLS